VKDGRPAFRAARPRARAVMRDEPAAPPAIGEQIDVRREDRTDGRGIARHGHMLVNAV